MRTPNLALALVLATLAALFGLTSVASAQYAFEGRTPDQIIDSVHLRRGPAERVAAAAWLLAHVPDDAAGLWARAVLADDRAAATQLARDCLVRRPGYDPCVYELVSASPDSGAELVHLLETHAGPDGAPTATSAVQDRVDAATIRPWLDVVRARSPRTFTLVRHVARLERSAGTYAASATHFEEAYSAPDGLRPFLVEAAVHAHLLDTAGSVTDRITRAESTLARFESLAEPPVAARAYVLAATQARSVLGNDEVSARFLVRSLQLSPSVEVFEGLYDVAERADDQQLLSGIAARALAAFPDDPVVVGISAWEAFRDGDLEHAATLALRSLSLTRGRQERRALTLPMTRLLQLVDRYDEACPRLAQIPDLAAAGDASSAAISCWLGAGNLSAAEGVLRAHRAAITSAIEMWFVSKRESIAAYRDQPLAGATSSAIPAGDATASDDGRYIAVGTSPLEVWDVRSRTLLARFRRGGGARFSPDGRMLAARIRWTEFTGGTTHAAIVYDIGTGRVAWFAQSQFEVGDIAWSPDSTRIVYYDGSGIVREVNLASGARRSFRASPRYLISGRVSWSRDGRRIYTAAASGNGIGVWDWDSLAHVVELSGAPWAHALGETADGAALVAVDNLGQSSIWPVSGAGARRTLQTGAAWSLSFHPTQPLAVASTSTDTAFVLDTATGRVVHEFQPYDRGSVGFLGTDRVFVRTAEGLALHETRTWQQREVWRAMPRMRASLPCDGRLITDFENRADVLEVATGHSQRLRIAAPLACDPSGGGVFGVDRGRVRRLDFATGATRDTGLRVHGDAVALAVSATHIAIAEVDSLDRSGAHPMADRFRIRVFDPAARDEVAALDAPIASRPLEYRQLYRGSVSLALTADHALWSTSWQDGYGHQSLTDRRVHWARFDAPTDLHEMDPGLGDILGGVAQAADGPRALSGARWATIDLEAGRVLASGDNQISPLDDGRRLVAADFLVEILDPQGVVLASRLLPRRRSTVFVEGEVIVVLDHTGGISRLSTADLAVLGGP